MSEAKTQASFRDSSWEILVIGGSLVGLTFALACANRGLRTRVVECSKELPRGGGTLGIDPALLARVVGADPRADGRIILLPLIMSYRQAVPRQTLHRWLRDQARERGEITLLDGVTIEDVTQSADHASAVTTEGEIISAPVLVGADGFHSTVRNAIDPGHAGPSYAGYMLWRGLVSEMNLPSDTPWPPNDDGIGFLADTGHYLVAYPVPGFDGSMAPGKRLISFSWYDTSRDSLLREICVLSQAGEFRSASARASLPEYVFGDLRELAEQIWPEPWRAFVLHSLDHREIFFTPVAEYCPQRLRNGRLAMLGDAAHVVSPMTGQGFAAGILDAEALAECLQGISGSAEEIHAALNCYEERRLDAAQSLARRSLKWSLSYVRSDLGLTA